MLANSSAGTIGWYNAQIVMPHKDDKCDISVDDHKNNNFDING